MTTSPADPRALDLGALWAPNPEPAYRAVLGQATADAAQRVVDTATASVKVITSSRPVIDA
jgi:hypothetical protein